MNGELTGFGRGMKAGGTVGRQIVFICSHFQVIPMSYAEEEDDDGDWFGRAEKLRRALADIPNQAQIVTDLSRKEIKRLRREVGRISPPKLPQKPPTKPISFDAFAGRRGRKRHAFKFFMTGKD